MSDWQQAPITPGTRLSIDASAGTGKTWLIVALYLRALLERSLQPPQIAVATFTNAAADELRERLRRAARRAEALASAMAACALTRGDAAPVPGDALTQWLYQRWLDAATCRRDLAHLRAVLAQFDVAPIGTLHSLSQRILREWPLEAGVVDGRIGDSAVLIEQLRGDLLRAFAAGAAHPLGLLAEDFERAEWVKLGKGLPRLLVPALALVAPGDAPVWPTAAASTLAEAATALQSKAAQVYAKNAALPRQLGALAALASRYPYPPARDIAALAEALPRAIERKGVLKAAQDDGDVAALAAAAEEVARTLAEIALWQRRRLWHAVSEWARAQYQRRQQARGERSFDDLIGDVHRALDAEAERPARPLADALWTQWPLALIDECQDTDPVQYAILDRIYCVGDAPRGTLVLVGDPKQAIYRFRGGDVESFLAARQRATDHLTLGTNHRSSKRMVAAVNGFYADRAAVLSDDPAHPIRYQPVAASARRDAEALTLDGAAVASPLVIHLNRQPSRASADRALALGACAAEVARLLAPGHARIGARALAASDIAVLLPSNADVATMAARLRELNVPTIALMRDSVMASDTARELRLLLHALDSSRDAHARAALLTRLWGMHFDQLRALDSDADAERAVRDELLALRELWLRHGPGAVVAALLERAAGRLLPTAGGERVLTDLRHLGELLDEALRQLGRREALLEWFGWQIAGQNDQSGELVDSRRLRLESDHASVRVMTVHASKGLEFGIVMLPLAYRQKPLQVSLPARIAVSAGALPKFDISAQATDHEARQLADESHRLLYVALTRAIYAAHVFGCAPGQRRGELSPIQSWCARYDGVVEPTMPDGISWHQDWPELGAARLIRDDAAAASAQPRSARPLPALPLGPAYAQHSFTSLTRRASRHADDEAATDETAIDGLALDPDDADQADAAAANETDAGDAPQASAAAPGAAPSAAGEALSDQALAALDGWRGASFGNAVHGILEHRDRSHALLAQRPLIAAALAEFAVAGCGPREAQISTLAGWLDRVVECPLWSQGPTLNAIAAADQVHEFAFDLSLERIELGRLHALAIEHGEPQLVPAGLPLSRGILTGRIDLVFLHQQRFHVLDYKTNFLGATLAAYAPARLELAMTTHDYGLQALLYSVALDRYLRQRLPDYAREQHLGEAIYLFVRAVGLAPQAGIWRRRFAPELIDAADRLLAGGRLAPSLAR